MSLHLIFTTACGASITVFTCPVDRGGTAGRIRASKEWSWGLNLPRFLYCLPTQTNIDLNVTHALDSYIEFTGDFLVLRQPYEVNTITMFTFQVRALRLKEVRELIPDHTARFWCSKTQASIS